MCSPKPGVEKHIDRYSALFSATSWVTACHSMSQHHNCPLALNPLAAWQAQHGYGERRLKDAKSMLRSAQSCVHLPFASCLQSASVCLHPLHSTNPIQSSFRFKSLFPFIFTCFNRVNPGYNRVYLYVFRCITSI